MSVAALYMTTCQDAGLTRQIATLLGILTHSCLGVNGGQKPRKYGAQATISNID